MPKGPIPKVLLGFCIAAVMLPGCRSRGGLPPNGLTAILRSVPAEAVVGALHVRAGDLAEARRALGLGRDDLEGLPEAALPPVSGSGWSAGEIDAWAQITSSAGPVVMVLVGRIDIEEVRSALLASGSTPYQIEITEIFVGGVETAAGALATALSPGRVVYGPVETVERIASFRGGDGSLLDLPGLRDTAVATGRAQASSVFTPATGCPRPQWIAAASRQEPGRYDTGLIWRYENPEAAKFAQSGIRDQLPGLLPRGAVIELVDSRAEQTVAILDAPADATSMVLLAAGPGGPFDGLPRCPQ